MHGRQRQWSCLLLATCCFSPAFAGDVDVVVYQAPKLFFASPENTPTLGPVVSMAAPDRPNFGSDPGERFALALADSLRAKIGKELDLPTHATQGPPRTSLIVNPAGAKSLIIYTTMNFLGYRPFGWRTYQYGYAAYIRVVDDNARTILETNCKVSPNKGDPELQLKRDELQTAGRFDEVVDRVVAKCADQVTDRIAAIL